MSEAWSPPPHSPGSSFEYSSHTAQRSDSELCAQIRQSSPNSPAGRAAFGELYSRHRLPALHVALRLNRDRSRAEDSVSEAFAKIWQAWGNGTGPDDSFKPYLMAAVRSESYRRKATTRATTAVEPDVLSFLAGPELLDYADEVAERDQLGRAFKTLPDSWQSAITMIDIDGVPVSAAAESMDLSSNSFSSLLRRAREGLRLAYLQEHVEPSRPECSDYAADLARYVRGQLGQRRIESLEAHLSRCDQCSSQAVRLRGLNTTFRTWMTPAVLAAVLVKIEHFPASTVPTANGSSGRPVPDSPSGDGPGQAANGGSMLSSVTGTIASIAAAIAIVAITVGFVETKDDFDPQPDIAAASDSAGPTTSPARKSEPAQDNALPQTRPSAAEEMPQDPHSDGPSAPKTPHDASTPEAPPTEEPAPNSPEIPTDTSAPAPPHPGSESDSNPDRRQSSTAGTEEATNTSDGPADGETGSDELPTVDDGETSTASPSPDDDAAVRDELDADDDASGVETPSPDRTPKPSERPSPDKDEPSSDDAANDSDDAANDSDDADDEIHCHNFGHWYFCH